MIHEQEILPWSQKTPDQLVWGSFEKRKEEVGRLILLSSLSIENDNFSAEMSSWIKRWQLYTPFETFFDGDMDKLKLHIAQVKYTPVIGLGTLIEERLESFGDVCDNVFSDPVSYSFFESRRKLLALGESTLSTEELSLACDLGYQNLYRGMVEAFWQTAQELALGKNRGGLDEFDDVIGLAGVKLSERVQRFFWDSYPINPDWTIRRFIISLGISVQSHESEKFDAYQLYTTSSPALLQPSPLQVEDQAMDDEFEEKLQILIDHWTDDPVKAEIIRLRLSREKLTHQEITEQIRLILGEDIRPPKVGRYVAEFGEMLRELDPEELGVTIPPKDDRSTLDQLMEDPERIRRLFGKRQITLTLFGRKLFTVFLDEYTGERNSSIDAVCKHFPNLKRSTIRRNIEKTLNLMLLRENPEYDNNRGAGIYRFETERALVIQTMTNPTAWESFTHEEQDLLTKRYINGLDGTTIAKISGINQSIVSRRLTRCGIKMRKIWTRFDRD